HARRTRSGSNAHRAPRPCPARRSSDLDAVGELVGAREVICPEVGGEPVLGVVREFERVPPAVERGDADDGAEDLLLEDAGRARQDRKSTRLNSSHVKSSYAVFCLTKKR